MENYDVNERYEEEKNKWREKNAKEFFLAIYDLIKPQKQHLSPDIAIALAYSHVNRNSRDSTLLFDTLGLTDYHAICYLDDITGSWGKDLDESYQNLVCDVDSDDFEY